MKRLWRWLFQPDCDECGARRFGNLHGNYWHKADCVWVTTPPRYPR